MWFFIICAEIYNSTKISSVVRRFTWSRQRRGYLMVHTWTLTCLVIWIIFFMTNQITGHEKVACVKMVQ